MKKTILSMILLLLAGNMLHAQGINFEQNETWAQIKDKAQKEHKYIFMDCYATWCGPCKWMSANIFPQKEVGDFMNANFISVAVQMDQTAGDNVEVKKWYADAKALKGQYGVDAYPTYLFFSPDGMLADQQMGATASYNEFLADVKQALDPSKRYKVRLKEMDQHLADSAYLHDLLKDAQHVHDAVDNQLKIENAYVQAVKYPLLKSNLILYVNTPMTSTATPVFTLIITNANQINQILRNPGVAERRIAVAINNQDLKPLFTQDKPIDWQVVVLNLKNKYPLIGEVTINALHDDFANAIIQKEIKDAYMFNDKAPLIDWTVIKKRIGQQYPNFTPLEMLDSLIAGSKYQYYAYKKMQPQCDAAILDYMKKYGDKLGDYNSNDICWNYVFMHSADKNLLLKAAGWEMRFIPDSTSARYYESGTEENMDTYANLLYKAGEKDKAIEWETLALKVLNYHPDGGDKTDKENCEVTLERMKAGMSTWEGRDKYGNYEKP